MITILIVSDINDDNDYQYDFNINKKNKADNNDNT